MIQWINQLSIDQSFAHLYLPVYLYWLEVCQVSRAELWRLAVVAGEVWTRPRQSRSLITNYKLICNCAKLCLKYTCTWCVWTHWVWRDRNLHKHLPDHLLHLLDEEIFNFVLRIFHSVILLFIELDIQSFN